MKATQRRANDSNRVTHKYALVIFDFDGTLADTFPWFASVLNSAADRFGFNRVTPEGQQALRDHDAKGILAHLGLPLWKVPMVAHHLRSLMTEHLHEISLFEGAAEVVQQLSSHGIVLALVTSNSETNARQLLGPSAAACFQHFVCGTSIFGKAHKVKKLLAHSGIAAQNTILVGDEIRDADAACACGVAFGAVSWGYNTPEALQACRPTEYFARMSDILTLLEIETHS